VRSLNINTGDTIVALGSTVSKDGVIGNHKELCTIVAVGKRDVFAQTDGGRVFKIPASRCVLVHEVECKLSERPLTPEIGDLVTSVSERFSKIEKKTGVLVEIIDSPGRIMMATILLGEKKEIVSYDSLIVLE